MSTRIPIYQVDAFAERPFTGNPAAVCPLEAWLPDVLMQQIAAENNLAETAFFVAEADGYRLRWFTPTVEVDLCGHATLASAHVLFEEMGIAAERIQFQTRSGTLQVWREDAALVMDFPAQPPRPCALPEGLGAALGATPVQVLASQDLFVVFEREEHVRALRPDHRALRGMPLRGVITTAPGESCDFVSRFFAPNAGIDEDPVTGSAHCALAPYWAGRLGRARMQARQLSSRGGLVGCEVIGERVLLRGACVPYLRGEVEI